MANDIDLPTLISARTQTNLDTQCPLYSTAGRNLQSMYVESAATPKHGLSFSYKENEYATGTPNGLSVAGNSPVDLAGRTITVTASEADIKNHMFGVTVTERDYEIRRGIDALTKSAKSRMIDSYADPAASVIMAKTEVAGYNALHTSPFYSVIDDPDKMTTFNSELDVFNLRKTANMLSLPAMNRRVFMPDEVNVNLAQTLLSRFNPVQNTKITRAGCVVGGLAGMDFYETSGSTYKRHVAGAQYDVASTFEVTSVSADGYSITLGSLGAATTAAFVPGDKIAIPSVKLFNKQSKVVLGLGYVATVTEVVDSVAGAATVKVNYPLIASGTHRNVSALPAANAPAKMFPSYDDVMLVAGQGFEVIELGIGDVPNVINSASSYGSGANKRALPIKTTLDGDQKSREAQVLMGSWTHFHAYSPFCLSCPSLPA